jgi:two-component system osmolarity sensor histidine kinase EnvZ
MIGRSLDNDLGQIPSLSFRPLAIRRLVTNLVDNALRYGIKDVKVSTRAGDGTITLKVSDRGPGTGLIDPNELIKPFFRENEARGSHLGAGLGLSIVERIARDHSGQLSLANHPDGGLIATVIFYGVFTIGEAGPLR